jgi:uncharacterized oxidoreductase
MQLSDNTVLITGGATGIGYAMAEAFLEAGSRVAICGRTDKRLLEARAKRPELQTRVCDVSKNVDRKGLIDWASAHLPGLNVLVNNAGVQRDVDFTNGIDDFLAGENEIRVNLESPIILSGLFVPLLAKNKGAAIINLVWIGLRACGEHAGLQRQQSGNFKANVSAKALVSAVMQGLANDVYEIGFGMTTGFIRASRADLDQSFQRMNSRM